MRSVLLLVTPLLLAASLSAAPERRVLNSLILDDIETACTDGMKSVQDHPLSQACWEAYIQALAKKGDVPHLLRVWNEFTEKFPQQREDRTLLESMAWGVIEGFSSSPSPVIRSYALIGAFYGQDSRGVQVIEKGMKDSNIAVRGLALNLSGLLRDDCLQEAAFQLLQEDQNLQIRLSAIQAVGQMKMGRAKGQLLKILRHPSTRAEEKLAVIQALVSLCDKITLDQARPLMNNRRAALRELACRVILHTEMQGAVGELSGLLNDSSPDVRCAALEAIGFLRDEVDAALIEKIKELSCDPHPRVAISAAWALTFFHPQEGYDALKPYLEGNHAEYRLLAGAALAATGQYGKDFLQPAFALACDPYLKMNLAFGLLVNDLHNEAACACITAEFLNSNDLWMWKEEGIFHYLSPSHARHVPWVANQPEMINQMTRLEVLNRLAIKEAPGALETAKNFLSGNQWGISGMAASLLLQEGDESAVELVQQLLQDSNPKVRVQAAFVLALWGGDDETVHILQESYAQAGREIKERILESLGSIGSKDSLAFLTQQLGEPQPTLKVIAAAALIQCLYH